MDLSTIIDRVVEDTSKVRKEERDDLVWNLSFLQVIDEASKFNRIVHENHYNL